MASRYPVRPCRVNRRTPPRRLTGFPAVLNVAWDREPARRVAARGDDGRRRGPGAGGFTTDYPRDLAVEVAREDGSWTRLAAEVVLDGPLVWAGTHVLRDGVERVALRFAPIRTGAVRLVQTSEDPVYDWSVAELHLVGP